MSRKSFTAGFGSTPTDIRHTEGWAGELRLNLVRLAAVILFYGYHLVHVYVARDDAALAGTFHVAVTALVMVWSIGIAVLYLFLTRRQVPPTLKYMVTAWDTLLVTALVVLTRDPRSPLVIIFFLLIAAAPLRLSVRLVVTATLLALGAYGFLLANYAFYQIGYERYYADPALQVSRTQEVLFALGLLFAGVLAGQVVRQARRLVGDHAASAGVPERDAEVRRDTTLVAAGLILVAVLVAFGLLFSAVLGPAALGSYAALPVVAVIAVLFLVAVVAAVVEVRRPEVRDHA